MVYTASRILDLLIQYYGQWQNRLWSHHYKLLSSLKQSIRTSELTDILETVSNRIRTEKHFHSKKHTSKLARDSVKNKEYLPIKDHDTDFHLFKYSNPSTVVHKKTKKEQSTRKKKKHRVPAFKLKRNNIKAENCLNKTLTPIETMEKSVINLSNNH